MQVLLVPIGSAGDVHPFIALGRELKSRGHSVTVLTSDYFKELVLKAGLDFDVSLKSENFKETLEDPRLWHPVNGFEFVARAAFLPLIPTIYRYIESHYKPGETLVVASSCAWGARIAQEKLGVPTVTLHLQPSVIMSIEQLPVYAGMAWMGKAPKFFRKLYRSLADRMTDKIAANDVNAFRQSVGLKPIRHILFEWTHSPLKTIGLFPEWFAPIQSDWPKAVELTNFPLNDADDIYGVPPAVEKFLSEGPAPVVFTAGSAMKQAKRLFDVSAEVCRKTGCRGILVNAFDDQLPQNLPPGVISVNYVPFQKVFRRAAMVVHHGGIGTTAQGLLAGVPQLITPFAHDQFDNAARVDRLGCGLQLLPAKYSVEAVSALVKRLTGEPQFRLQAEVIRAKLAGQNGIVQTCDLLEEVVR